MSDKQQQQRPQPQPQRAPFWRAVAKRKRARRLSDKAGYRKGWW
jgi:hypothetical protein